MEVVSAEGELGEAWQHQNEGASGSGSSAFLIDGRPALLVAETAGEEATEGGEGSSASSGGKTETHSGTASENPKSSDETHANETGGESAVHKAQEGSKPESAAELSGETHSEKLLGLDPEATGMVVLAVVISLILALAVWFRPTQTLLLVVALATHPPPDRRAVPLLRERRHLLLLAGGSRLR